MSRPGNTADLKANAVFGVVFDMDGVLIDSAELHLESWRQLARENGRTITESDFRATFGRQNFDIVPVLFGDHSNEQIRILADRKEEIFRSLIRKRPPVVSGAVKLIRALFSDGARLAVGSSAPLSNIKLVLEAMHVYNEIHSVVSSEDVSRGKPDPQVFVEACRRLGLAPEKCVVIEDAVAGIEAARRAGTRTVAVTIYHAASSFEGADLIVERLAALTVDCLSSLVDR